MFTDKLFDHKYDIDDIIAAFCAHKMGGRFILNSRSGTLFHETDEQAATSPYKEGDDKGHIREILPLPISFIDEMRTNPELNRAEPQAKQQLLHTLSTVQTPDDLPALFETTYGGWIRERVKDACLEWLELHNMIPPSMRHVRDISTPEPKDMTGVKINIS